MSDPKPQWPAGADPMTIWVLGEDTDPEYTSLVPGGAGLTAVKPQYTIRRLTEVFGPCGIGWGVEIVSEGVLGEGKHASHGMLLRMWYVWVDKSTGLPISGEVYDFGETAMYRGDKPVADVRKSSFSDGINRCARLLGVNANVFLGDHDAEKAHGVVISRGLEKVLRPWQDDMSRTKEQFEVVVQEMRAQVADESPAVKQAAKRIISEIRAIRGWDKT